MMPEVDLLEIERGCVVAPAGCGKTHLIAAALKHHGGGKPILALTHTNAGVAALRGRLDCLAVPRASYRLSTIDGWAMRLVSAFPIRSGLPRDVLKLENPRTDYPAIRAAAVGLLEAGHVSDIVSASYARLIVDEYQDCSILQHRLASGIAEVIPASVLGDRLQAIFGFGSDGLAQWEDVLRVFPPSGELSTPWRWVNANAESLGRWLLEVRQALLRGSPIDLRGSPESVAWVPLRGVDDHVVRLRACRTRAPDGHGSVLIIADSTNPASHRKFASETPGAVTVERVDLPELMNFARGFDVASSDAPDRLVAFAGDVMRNVGAPELIQRVRSLQRGTARKEPTEAETAVLEFVRTPSLELAARALSEINRQPGVVAHRPAVLSYCLKALNDCRTGGTFHEAAIRIRERSRVLGRPLDKRSVGSTLLLKGLEAEVSVILNPTSMSAEHLYVALTRGSKALVICAADPVLRPR